MEALGSSPTLLALDNCEHLLESSAAFARSILENCPAVRILATSRCPLNVQGEKEYRVPYLTYSNQAAEALAHPSSCTAVQLFLERARIVDPTFQLTAANIEAVCRICSELHGVPLLIELAAAKLKVLGSAQNIAAHLHNQLSLLAGERRGVGMRHQQTLKSTLDWSFHLLPDCQARLLLLQLSIFPGQWTLEAAETIGGGEEIAPREVLKVLGVLLDHSLVVRTEDSKGHTRFQLLETVRQYAAEKRHSHNLFETALRERFIHYFCGLAEANFDVSSLEKLSALDEETPNLLEAARLAIEEKSQEAIVRLSWRLNRFLELRGLWLERRRLLVHGVRAARVLKNPHAEGRNWNNLGTTYRDQGFLSRAARCYQKALYLFGNLSDPGSQGKVLHNLGSAYRRLGRWQEAEECYHQDLKICLAAGDRLGQAQTLNSLGVVHRSQGHWTQAEEYYRQAFAILRTLEDRMYLAQALNNLGDLLGQQDRFTEALGCHQEALGLFEALQSPGGEGVTYNNLGSVYHGLGPEHWKKAEQCLLRALEIKQKLGERSGEAISYNKLGDLYQSQERWSEAEQCMRQDLSICRELRDKLGEGESLASLARLHAAQGNLKSAAQAGREALSILHATGDQLAAGEIRRLLTEWEAVPSDG